MIRLFGRLFDPDDRGLCLVTVEGSTVTAISTATTAPDDAIGGPDTRILPGLLDIQVNGAFGDDFADPASDIDGIRRRMAQFGVTAFVPTIVTSPADAYAPALAHLTRPRAAGAATVLGAHIEGPYLSPSYHGTHNPALLRAPDRRQALGWLDAGEVRYVTLAPELPGALEVIDLLVRHGVRVAIGHTDATWDQAQAAADAGASLVTHLFNAMRPLRGRDPGVVGHALRSHLSTGFIGDGNHIAFETIGMLARIKGPDELHLVTDALAGLGMPPGRYRLADQEYISDGTAGRLPDGTLSGSLLPLNRSLRNLVDRAGLEPALAVRLATLNPARALGVDHEHGRVAVGRPADLTLVGDDWEVLLTVIGGAVAFRAEDDGHEAGSAPA